MSCCKCNICCPGRDYCFNLGCCPVIRPIWPRTTLQGRIVIPQTNIPIQVVIDGQTTAATLNTSGITTL